MKWWKALKDNRARRMILGLGAGSFVAGLALVVLAAYSALGGQTAARDESVTVAQISTRTPVNRTPLPTDAPASVTPVPTPPLEGQPYRFVFEKLGVDAPVETFGLDENAVPVVPTGDNAAEIVAWYNFSAQPGTGNAVFAGHVTWFGEAVFFDLKTSEPGDAIKLRGEDGTELTYVVSSVSSVDANDPESVKVMSATDPPSDVITIITCDGAFQDTDDPVFGGEYSRRLVVRAERVV